ncbi:hypothetical protein DdX_01859 [Ditylenchus destructor]|uniref:Uncharacterized protein n=1 Tax=Ditylenchus destructor TaxID=166010 RepID=A0AAD4RE21_9BILA|nr:hypothetical protein DdX_01859 [Ditylenchus destructor]
MDCKFPIIEPEELDIKEYVHKYRSINCISQMPNLASFDIDTHKLIIHNELEPYRQWTVPEFRCYYRGIGGGLSPSISNYDWLGEEVQVTQDEEVEIPYDQFVVICRNVTPTVYVNDKPRLNNSVIYERAFAGFVNSTVHKENFVPASEDSPSLSILVLDSIARSQFLRHMPKTVEMMKRLGFIWLDGYTKVGDNSAVNLLPVLAGKSILPKVGESDESELVPNGTIVNLEETIFLWDIMKRKNCVTLFNDDILDIRRGLFHYPNDTFIGFRKTPTDYYFRAYHLYNPKKMFYPKAGGQCMKTGQVTTEEYLDIWEKFSTIYKDRCHFSFNFFTELTHDEPSNLGAIDIRMRTSLERMLVNGIFNTTAFVIMGDHGNRISPIQRTYVGRIEERTPFFSVYLPDNFRRKNQALLQNFQYNIHRLSSNFDVHQTLRFIAGLGAKDTWSAKMPNRGMNLLTNRILTKRTCPEAGIAKNFCLCMEKKNISRFGRDSKEYVKIELLLKKHLEPLKCLQHSSLKIMDDKLTPLVINQMVRHGLRNQTE